jgi:hypothetical protein
MIARITAWLGAWKYVLILSGLLALSLWGNLHQYVASKTAPLREENKALADTLDKVRGIASDKTGDDKKLLGIVQGIADQRVKRETIYQSIVTPLPANCAPGRARMDAVNQGIPLPPGAKQ